MYRYILHICDISLLCGPPSHHSNTSSSRTLGHHSSRSPNKRMALQANISCQKTTEISSKNVTKPKKNCRLTRAVKKNKSPLTPAGFTPQDHHVLQQFLFSKILLFKILRMWHRCVIPVLGTFHYSILKTVCVFYNWKLVSSWYHDFSLIPYVDLLKVIMDRSGG